MCGNVFQPKVWATFKTPQCLQEKTYVTLVEILTKLVYSNLIKLIV
jgi:hypothetical protein